MDLKDKEKIVRVIGAADAALAKLEENVRVLEAQGKSPAKADNQLLKSIYRALDILKKNPFAGDAVQKEKIPRELLDLPNLFRMELSQHWRLLYYVAGDEVRVVVVVFEISDHQQYDRLFGYRKK